MRLRRLILYLFTIVAFLCLCSLVFTVQHSGSRIDFSERFEHLDELLAAAFTRGCPDLKDLRHQLELPPTIQFAKRTIWLTAVDALKPQSLVKVKQKLIPSFETINIDDGRCILPDDVPEDEEEGFIDRITIEYLDRPAVARNDTSTLLIGLSSNAQDLENALPQISRWLGNTNVSLVASVYGSKHARDLEKLQEKAEAAGIDAKLVMGEMLGGQNADFVSALKVLTQHRRRQHKWFVLVEDDTFITSIPALLEALNSYSPSRPWYLGALSENANLLSRPGGFTAYEGAGVIFSAPMMDKISENLVACAGEKDYRNCVLARTTPHVRLTQLDGLHPIDLSGDVSGWYESGVSPVLSLHNFNGRHRYPVEFGYMVVDTCGEECFLQRYRFKDDVVLTNGYSVNQYPNGSSTLDLDRVEGTFPSAEGQFDFSLGLLRPRLPQKDKVSWRLEYAQKAPNGSVRQFYVKRKAYGKDDEERLNSEVESVLELEWRHSVSDSEKR